MPNAEPARQRKSCEARQSFLEASALTICCTVHAGGTFISSMQLLWVKTVPLWANSTQAFWKTVQISMQCESWSEQIYLNAGTDAIYPWSWAEDSGTYMQFPSGLTNMTVP